VIVMATHKGRVLPIAVMIVVFLTGSSSALGQNRKIEAKRTPSEGWSPYVGSFSVNLARGQHSESSTGGSFSVHGKGLQLPLAAMIFNDGFESGDTSLWSATVPDATALPSGAVMFFNATVCPSSWSPLETVRGRTVVGRPAGGTLGGTVVTPMNNLSERAHSHAVNGSITVEQGGEHSHWWAYLFSSEKRWISYTFDYKHEQLITWDNGIDAGGSGTYPFAYPLGEDHPFITSRAGYHAHALTYTHLSDGTIAVLPYLQLLACVKD